MTIKHIIEIDFQHKNEAEDAIKKDKDSGYIYMIIPNTNLIKPEIICLLVRNGYEMFAIGDNVHFRHRNFCPDED